MRQFFAAILAHMCEFTITSFCGLVLVRSILADFVSIGRTPWLADSRLSFVAITVAGALIMGALVALLFERFKGDTSKAASAPFED